MWLGEVCCATLHLVSPTFSLSFPILSFSCFQSDFHAAFWRPIRAPIYLNLVSLERCGCIVSIEFDLVQFGVTVVEILSLEGK